MRLKLVSFFLLLSVLPLAAIFWGYTSVARTNETSRVDARLQAGLRATVADYADELAAAQRSAELLAASRGFRQALLARDTGSLHQLLRDSPEIMVQGPAGFRVGQAPPLAAQRSVSVFGGGGLLGRVVVSIRLDTSFVRRLQRRSGLEPYDRLVLVRQGTIVAGRDAGATLLAAARRAGNAAIAGVRYRSVAAAPLDEPRGATFVVLSPRSRIDAASARAERRLLLGIGASLALVALAAYLLGRTITRTLSRLVAAAGALARGDLGVRVPVRGRDELSELGRAFNEMAAQLEARVAELETERLRLREATARLGDALAATHDVDLLLRVIVETAVESTGASGGWIDGEGGRAHVTGSPDGAPATLRLPLQAGPQLFGTLVLAGSGFSSEEHELAVSFAAEAVIALENARLHGIVERQAAQDGLTGLANRRHGEQALATEVARVERYEGSAAFVLADLDGFKGINDRHGHPTGDAVLREFAAVVLAALREVDVAARWGGEEFAFVLPGTDAAGAAQVAERVRAALATRLVLAPDGSPIPVTASFGVAAAPEHGTAESLVAAADAALYEAKRTGKNRVVRAGARVGSA